MVQYRLEYAKSGRAKCHGKPPTCDGSPIGKGALRHGEIVPNPFGNGAEETTKWRHWGCVPKAFLDKMGNIGVINIPGFRQLRPEDQQKVQAAVAAKKIAAADVPSNAFTLRSEPSSSLPSSSLPSSSLPSSVQQPAASSTGHKRKHVSATDVPSSSQPSSSLARSAVSGSSSQPIQVDEEDDDGEADRDEVYVTMASQVVGIQYYNGMVGSGEQVLLVREPSNKFDRNAIQVKNIGGTQVGHIPARVAARLAPLMDRGLVTVEGTMTDSKLSQGTKQYKLNMNLAICGPADPARRAQLELLLVWATPGQRGFPPPPSRTGVVGTGLSPKKGERTPVAPWASGVTQARLDAAKMSKQKAEELNRVLDGFQRVNDEGRRDSLLDTLCAEDDILKIPEHPNPPGKANGQLTTDLLKHQSQALKWCIDREYPNDHLPMKESDRPVQFWQLRKTGNQTYWFNLATQTPQATRPEVGRGGLMADAMGLGKTLTMIALIIATRDDVSPAVSKSTLIVVPLSVIGNWESQIAEHVKPGLLSVHVYHGTGRDISADKLATFDIVLTTYQSVAGDVSTTSTAGGPAKKRAKKSQPLFEVNWKRVILDDCHTVRNPKARMTQAVCGLQAERRWVVTGTPIINAPSDLGTLLSFLRICRPLDQPEFFKRLLVRPLTLGSPDAVDLLKALMSSICIRRTKEMQDENGKPLIPLPPVEVIIVRVTLDGRTRELYNAIETESQNQLADYLASAGRNPVTASANVLSLLTRLRQLAIHPALVPPNYLEDLRAAGNNTDGHSALAMEVSLEDRIRLQSLLAKAIEDSEECPICFDVLKEPRILPCTHNFCLPCISTVIQQSPSSTCPMDRRPISMGDLIEPPQPSDDRDIDLGDDVGASSSRAATPSAKTRELIHLLKLTPAGDKSLVFSQFTSYLDKIAAALEEEDIPFVRFDGSLSAKKRQDVLAQFSQPLSATDNSGSEHEDRRVRAKGKGKRSSRRQSKQNPVVMLISLKAGALGLNLTVANNVFLMDPWWQESIESQAIDRVNRIGQRKNVTVYQMIADDTVESKVLEIQERKKQLIKQAFSGTKTNESPRAKKEARLQDLIELFGARGRA